MKNFLKKALVAFGMGGLLLAGGMAMASQIPVSPSVFETYLASQEGTSDTSLFLASVTLRDSTALSGYVCVTVDANTPSLEYECGTASGTSITGLLRGLDAVTGTTSLNALIFSHRRGADVKITDYPSLTLLQRIADGLDGFTGLVHYDNQPNFIGVASTSIATKGYVDTTAASGAANSSETVNGISQLSTAAQASAGTSLGSTGARLVLPGSLATSTCQGVTSSVLVASSTTGKLNGTCFDGAPNYAFSGTDVFSGSTNFTGTTTLATTTVNGTTISPKFGGTGVDGALSITSATTTVSLGNAAVYVKNYTSINITATGSLAFSNPATTGSTIILKSQGACNLTSTALPLISLTGIGAAGGAAVSSSANGNNGNQTTYYQDALNHYGAGGNTTAASIVAKKFQYGVDPLINTAYKLVLPIPGSGGGSGQASGSGNSGAGGIGGGALYLECGSLNFTGTIQSLGGVGGNTSGTGAGGGGGAGGEIFIIYNSLITNSGTMTVTGGNGGNGSGDAGGQGGALFVAGGTAGNSGSNDTGNGGSAGTGTTASGGGGAGGLATTTLNYIFY